MQFPLGRTHRSVSARFLNATADDRHCAQRRSGVRRRIDPESPQIDPMVGAAYAIRYRRRVDRQ